jgi:hypothetical protein
VLSAVDHSMLALRGEGLAQGEQAGCQLVKVEGLNGIADAGVEAGDVVRHAAEGGQQKEGRADASATHRADQLNPRSSPAGTGRAPRHGEAGAQCQPQATLGVLGLGGLVVVVAEIFGDHAADLGVILDQQ